ncbi:MAG: tRNA (N(6)-L-threonylcarbamoyladenosine(37)-C(2))-methylthiotransferase MtaB [Sphingobacteriales bacterium]|nr:tRNA (N(6)-L-threonylcarbamoyladenosine(37)-C(2))-methylthiotransferase MtaB [Sphingobacteriales bacterium]
MLTDKKIAFHTLGCKLNFSETSAIARKMQERGFTTVDFEEPSDVYVINTCSVTEHADTKCRNIVRKAMKQNPDAYVVVVGCYAQLKPKEIASIKGVDLVLGASEKFRLPEIITDLTKNPCGQVFASEISNANFFVDAYSVGDRTRSFLKIQDGCDYKCSFCTIPLARGKSRSDTPENIRKNAGDLAAKGVKEIVLTGVNTGDYGKGIEDEYTFLDIIKILDEVEGIERFRISSIEPNLLTDEIIEFVSQSKRFMPHFHIPLQSGSDKMLKLMQRRYKSALYKSRVEKIKSVMPHACIGVDVIVGFPGETDDDFLDTYNFIHALDISYLHVFTYSERQNTRAIEMEGTVLMPVRNERNAILRTLSEKKKRYFYQQFLGTAREVLMEQEQHGEVMHGFTDNYIKISVPYDAGRVNQVMQLQLVDIDGAGNVYSSILP